MYKGLFMNEPPEPLSDEILDNLLAAHRDIAIPHKTQQANRAALKRALARRARPPWWRQTVAVPIPVAIAAMVVLAVAVIGIWWRTPAQPGAPQTVSATLPDRLIATESSAGSNDDRMSRSSWSVARSYLPTVISVGSGNHWLNLELRKEKRNES
jgi:hypothetical protein